MNTDHVPGLVRASLEDLSDLVPRTGLAFVTDEHLARLPRVRSVIQTLGDVTQVTLAVGEPTSVSVADVVTRLRGARSSAVVALGGGSVLDTAKLAAFLAAGTDEIASHLETVGPPGHSLGLVAIPTTSGSGAEVTRTCVVSHRGRKTWAWNDALRPGTVLVDPTLTHGLSAAGTVATGLDALVHAFEATTAPTADRPAIDSGGAAIETILEMLPVAVARLDDATARSEMLDAAICAGFAIDRAGTGLGHAVGHAIASIFPIPHGLSVAFGMWATLDWVIAGAGESHRRVDPSGTLGARLGATLEEIGFWKHLARWASRPLDPVAFADELAQPAHRPMCLNGARPADGEDLPEVAGLVVAAWNARFG